MDIYSSLLNLNFMTSLRTGNLIVDMLIAVLIPVISGMIHHFFRDTWPDLIHRALNLFARTNSTTMIQPPFSDTSGDTLLEVSENTVLSEAITQYVGRKVKPMCEKGAYRYKRPPGALGDDRSATLVDVLQKSYCVQTVPAEDCSVSVAPALKFSVILDKGTGTGDGGRADGGGGDEDGRGGGGGKRGTRTKNRSTSIALVTTQTAVMAKDVAYTFIADAWAWYMTTAHDTSNRDRYLLQPLLDKASGENELMRCQFFPLSQEKTFNTLFFPEKARLISLIDQFQSQTGKFAVPGFPHKLVLLLYGPPGTGKTSLVKALATYTGRDLFSIPLSRVQTNRQLLQYMFDGRCHLFGTRRNQYSSDQSMKLAAKKVIYVLEDIDAASGVVLHSAWKDVSAEAKADDGQTNNNALWTKEVTQLEGEHAMSDGCDGGGAAEDAARQGRHNESGVESEEAVSADAPSSAGDDSDEDDGDDDVASSVASSTGATKKSRKVDKVTINTAAKTDKLSIHGVLAALNGILNSPGRIVVMTTNHIEHLDAAVTRPGVVTMKLHMAHFSPACAVEMVQHYFAHTAESGHVPQELLDQVYKEVAERRGKAFSPAEVEQLCAENDTVEDLILALRKGSGRDVF